MSKNNIKIDDFKGFNFSVDYKHIIQSNCKTTRNMLINKSPEGVRGKYKKGWTYVIFNNLKNDEIEGVVWNKPNWQLTWLLERGHLITNKVGGVGWASPQAHIFPTAEKMIPKFIRDMEKAKIKFDFK